MAAHERQQVTSAAFSAFLQRPEHRGQSYELIQGEIVPVVSNPKSSRLGFRIAGYLFQYLEDHPLGEATGADGGYVVGSDRYIPDVGFVRASRLVTETVDGYLAIAPDLAVEVLSPANTAQEMRCKIASYLAAGSIVWVIDDEAQQVEIYAPGQPPRVLGLADMLSGGDLLPGFALPLSALFRPQSEQGTS